MGGNKKWLGLIMATSQWKNTTMTTRSRRAPLAVPTNRMLPMKREHHVDGPPDPSANTPIGGRMGHKQASAEACQNQCPPSIAQHQVTGKGCRLGVFCRQRVHGWIAPKHRLTLSPPTLRCPVTHVSINALRCNCVQVAHFATTLLAGALL